MSYYAHPPPCRIFFPPQQSPAAFLFFGKHSNSDENKDPLSDTFSSMDKNHDNFLTKDEVIDRLQSLNLPTSEEYTAELFKQYDTNKDSLISMEEYRAYMKKKERKMHNMYENIIGGTKSSKNKSSKEAPSEITPDVCLKALRDIGIAATINDAKIMVKSIDRDGDNQVSYEEFRAAVGMLPASQLNQSLILWDWLTTAAKESSVSPPLANTTRQLLAGGVAGCVSKIALAPIERIRTMVISQGGAAAGQSIMELAQSVLRKEGVKGLWKGTGTALVKVFPSKGISFTVHDGMKEMLRMRRNERLSVGDQLFASGTAGVVTQAIIHPLDVVQTRQSLGENGNLLVIAIRIVKRDGPGGLYRGLLPSLFAEVLGCGLGLFAYDFSCNLFEKVMKRRAQPGDKALVAMISSFCTSTLTMPVFVVQKLLMSQGNPGVPVYNGFFDAAQKIMQKSGPLGFYRGAGITYARLLPSISLTFFLYEVFQKNLGVGGIQRYRH